VNTATEHAGTATTAGDAGTCAAVCNLVCPPCTFFGIEAVCGEPAAGRFTRICVHEHVGTGLLCRDHADHPEQGFCKDCNDLPDGLSHDCPIHLAETGTPDEHR
jgi:hypothetical protein